jgi:hypothetical protein
MNAQDHYNKVKAALDRWLAYTKRLEGTTSPDPDPIPDPVPDPVVNPNFAQTITKEVTEITQTTATELDMLRATKKEFNNRLNPKGK